MFNWIKENLAIIASILILLSPFILMIFSAIWNKIEKYMEERNANKK